MGINRMRWPYPCTPVLGRNLPANLAEAEKVFDERVKAKFLRGMSEADLVDELRSQGFSISVMTSSTDHSASLIRGMIFKTLWSIRWRARAAQIEDILGVYGFIAP